MEGLSPTASLGEDPFDRPKMGKENFFQGRFSLFKINSFLE
jgi:hypothetical protein